MKLFIAKCADVRVDIMIMNEIFVYRSRAVSAIHLNKFAVKFAIKTDNEEIKGLSISTRTPVRLFFIYAFRPVIFPTLINGLTQSSAAVVRNRVNVEFIAASIVSFGEFNDLVVILDRFSLVAATFMQDLFLGICSRG